MNNIPTIVYHYCSLESFLSIIKSGTIRLSNISKSNDTDEIKYCFDAFQKTLKYSCLLYSRQHITDKEQQKFFNEIDYDSLVTRAVINDSLVYYTACFSTESDLLSQWRGYANDGKGVAIGFYTHDFFKANELKNLKFDKITYNMSVEQDKLKKYVINNLNAASLKTTNENFISVYMNAINDVISGMVYKAVFNKNPAFQEENEWRLVFYPFGNIRNLSITHKSKDLSANQLFYDRMLEPIEYEREYNGLIRGKLQFRCTDNKIISYIDVDFNNIKDRILAEIVIEPKANIDDKDLRLFLLSNGFDLSKINIKKSRATYQ